MPTRFLVTRHLGALEWADATSLYDKHVTSLNPAEVQEGDTVLGTLPIAVAAQVIARGAKYVHLTIDVPPELRGTELTSAEMRGMNARLEHYHVERRPDANLDMAFSSSLVSPSRPICMVAINSKETLSNLVPVLNTKPEKLLILDSGAFPDQVGWLKAAIKARLPGLTFELTQIGTSNKEVVDKIFPKLLEISTTHKIVSNITGGLKPMSLALAEATRRIGGEVIYFDVERNSSDRIYPLGGATMLPPQLDVDVWCRAHGFSKIDIASSDLYATQTNFDRAADLAGLASFAIIRDLHSIVEEMNPRGNNNPRKLTGKWTSTNQALSDLLRKHGVVKDISGIPRLNFLTADEQDFYKGTWFEYWVLRTLRNSNLASASACGVALSRTQLTTVENELDVLAIVGNRPICIECKARFYAGKTQDREWLDKLSAVSARVGGSRSLKLLISAGKMGSTHLSQVAKAAQLGVIHGEGCLDEGELTKALTEAFKGSVIPQELKRPKRKSAHKIVAPGNISPPNLVRSSAATVPNAANLLPVPQAPLAEVEAPRAPERLTGKVKSVGAKPVFHLIVRADSDNDDYFVSCAPGLIADAAIDRSVSISPISGQLREIADKEFPEAKWLSW